VTTGPSTGPHRHTVTVNGLSRPFALAGGRAAAAGTLAGGQVVLTPCTALDAETQALPDNDAAYVTRFLGASRPAPYPHSDVRAGLRLTRCRADRRYTDA